MKIGTGFQIGTARFDCLCYGLRIGHWFSVKVIKKYLGMCGTGVFDHFSRMFFFFSRGSMDWKWMQKHTQKLIICLVGVH